MTNSHDRDRHNLVNFLRQNQPVPPQPCQDLERRIIELLEPVPTKDRKRLPTVTWTIPGAIATGVLFTTVSFGVRTPRVAIEPKDLENFLVSNWQNTLSVREASIVDDNEASWLLPKVSEPEPALSVSAK